VCTQKQKQVAYGCTQKKLSRKKPLCLETQSKQEKNQAVSLFFLFFTTQAKSTALFFFLFLSLSLFALKHKR
jgi:hypothetical protein